MKETVIDLFVVIAAAALVGVLLHNPTSVQNTTRSVTDLYGRSIKNLMS